MRGGVVVFFGVFGVLGAATWCGCSSASSSTFDVPDAAAADSSCQGSLDDCPCGTIADLCGQVDCLSTLTDAEDASAWGSVPNCETEKSTNVCSNTIEVTQHGIDTGSMLYFDAATGALLGVVDVNNLKWSCWGTIPGANCDDIWTLAPIFGTFDAGVCIANDFDAGMIDAGDAD